MKTKNKFKTVAVGTSTMLHLKCEPIEGEYFDTKVTIETDEGISSGLCWINWDDADAFISELD